MDWRACYDVLASRVGHDHDHGEHCEHEEDAAPAPPVAETTGTCIADEKEGEAAVAPATTALESLTLEPSLSAPVLIQRFMALQEQRVSASRDFQAGFQQHKATPRFTAFCSEMTAQFADLSAQVNAIEKQLRSQQRDDLGNRLRRVQEHEREKLMLVSALGVEQMRLDDMQHRHEADQDAQITALLEASITKLTQQHTDVIVKINEELDELRIAMLEEEEDEDEDEDAST